MKVVVERHRVHLAEAEVFTAFEVVSHVDHATARAALHTAGAGRFTEGGEVAVPFGWVRFAAGPVAESDAWRDGFDKMVAYARTKGWITPEFEILGHVVQGDTSAPRFRTAVVGLGVQGGGIVRGLEAVGHEVVAGVDIGDRVGKTLAAVVSGAKSVGPVLGSVADLIAAHPDLDVVVLAAAVELDTTTEWAGDLVEAGINVVSLDHSAFSYDASWVAALDERAHRGRGGSFMGVGVQDVAWVQLIAVGGGAVAGATEIRLTNLVPIEVLSEGLLMSMGAGSTPEELAARPAPEHEEESTLVSGPLVEAARLLGATPLEITRAVELVVADVDYDWQVGGRVIPAGTVRGVRETASFDTDLGIRFTGAIEIVPGGEERSENIIEFTGDPNLRVTLGPITTSVTDTALISRIPDVVAAPPGAVFSADLAPARHQTRRTS